jgi:hypothetical protein
MLNRKLQIKEKLSGKLFMVLNISDKNITLYCEKFNHYIYEKYKIPFEDYVLENSKDDIMNEVKLFVSMI